MLQFSWLSSSLSLMSGYNLPGVEPTESGLLTHGGTFLYPCKVCSNGSDCAIICTPPRQTIRESHPLTSSDYSQDEWRPSACSATDTVHLPPFITLDSCNHSHMQCGKLQVKVASPRWVWLAPGGCGCLDLTWRVPCERRRRRWAHRSTK